MDSRKSENKNFLADICPFCKDFYMLFSMTFYRKILSSLPDEIIMLILDYCSLSQNLHQSYAQFIALSNEDKMMAHWVSAHELSTLCSPALLKCLHEFKQNG